MGLFDLFNRDKIKETIVGTLDEIQQGDIVGFDKRCYGFISLNNGAGTKTVATNVAIELSKKYSVCIVDFNIFQPGVWVLLNTPVKSETSLVRYFASNMELKDGFLAVDGVKNLRFLSTSPLDPPMLMGDVRKEDIDNLLDYVKEAFDYVIIYMNYNPFAEWFVYSLFHLDKGYFVWDEQVDCALKTKVVLDFVHKVSGKANNINNIILNKATRRAYDYKRIDQIESNFISELPFVVDIINAKNLGKIYMKSDGVDKRYSAGIKVIVSDIEEGQSSQKESDRR